MPKFKNEEFLKEVGKRLKAFRLQQSLEIEDVSEMTGFTYNTIKNVEDGNEMTLSYFVEICKAIQISPKQLLDFDIDPATRFELTPTRKEKSRLTARIKAFVEHEYFIEERTAQDIVQELKEEYGVQTTTAAVSVILNRLVDDGVLEAKKETRVHLYKVQRRR